MIGMQYKVRLPKDYDMEIIRKRVQDNGYKTDGFPGLRFKAYLITETRNDENLYNSYSPLYIWNDSEGMNRFIFEGFYDTILNSFGWQQINIGVPLSIDFAQNFNESKYVVEATGHIPESKSLKNLSFPTSHHDVLNAARKLGDLLVYNPDKWGYSAFSFYQEKPLIDASIPFTLYEILHVSE